MIEPRVAYAPRTVPLNATHALKCSRILVPRSSSPTAAERGHCGRRGLLFVVALNHKEEILSPRSAGAGGDSRFIAAEAQPYADELPGQPQLVAEILGA